jgi:hypothetical protein
MKMITRAHQRRNPSLGPIGGEVEGPTKAVPGSCQAEPEREGGCPCASGKDAHPQVRKPLKTSGFRAPSVFATSGGRAAGQEVNRPVRQRGIAPRWRSG